ncbi:Cof-type HAD-IIB family hydrolase [Deinococcus roseus]|uniref:Cof-type HAD-IIB family hydrolase n=1 Tax=Deinococcus roseus TaxID=392414 RepID=A0ABQ2CYL3_9DEIO|nr:Cof-type HAD-IIB family hydrolase [Deinococcus roseus]GGJ29517.1 hypothetical protein GCM10008938_14510 [Deinococcus roseus]
MLKLVCIDVDGTLVGSSGTVTEEVWEATREARSRGQHLVICTGRPAFGKALGYAQKLDPEGWHIFQNGASIYHVQTGETLSASFPEELLPWLEQLGKEKNWVLELYSDTDYAVEDTHRFAREHAELLGLPFDPRPFTALKGTPVRAQWVIPIEQTRECMALMPESVTLSPAGSPIMPDAMFISMTRKGVSKASGIQKIADKLGLTIDQVMMVGDGHNDAEAMKVVGHGVAMANADDEARAAANHHVGHVDEGGLIEALELSWIL